MNISKSLAIVVVAAVVVVTVVTTLIATSLVGINDVFASTEKYEKTKPHHKLMPVATASYHWMSTVNPPILDEENSAALSGFQGY